MLCESEALLLESRVGEPFDRVVTSSTPDGVWERTFSPPAEGKLVQGMAKREAGKRLRVNLQSTNVDHGFSDPTCVP